MGRCFRLAKAPLELPMTVQTLATYLPLPAVEECHSLLQHHRVQLRIVSKRMTRHGDYRKFPDGTHRITVNASSNPYRFLLTLIHEIAHLVAFETHGRNIKPHGPEWKATFKLLMARFIRPEIWPEAMLPVLARHFRNPKASSSTDLDLALELKKYDPPTALQMVADLREGTDFRLYNGKVFRKGKQRVKRIECLEIKSGRVYLFQPHAEVEPMQ